MFKAIDKWLPGYIRAAMRKPGKIAGVRHLIFCIADHFEPFRGQSPKKIALATTQRWITDFPTICRNFRDSDGIGPRHTFFFPADEYDADCVDMLAGLAATGGAEIEIHLHHRNDTPEGFRDKLAGFRDLLRTRHGLLGSDSNGLVRYGFIHGNWSLCNSRPDGDWCGVNEELDILSATGCYADLTFPSAPSPTQPRTVNAIYRARDYHGKPRGHDRGELVTTGCGKAEGLMLIQGPLGLDWSKRKFGILPGLENAELSAGRPPDRNRIPVWIRQAIHVIGKPEWIFVKVHTHGAWKPNADLLLGDAMKRFHDGLCSGYNDGRDWRLHYATAREMYNIVRAAECGEDGEPGEYRDYEIKPPPAAGVRL